MVESIDLQAERVMFQLHHEADTGLQARPLQSDLRPQLSLLVVPVKGFRFLTVALCTRIMRAALRSYAKLSTFMLDGMHMQAQIDSLLCDKVFTQRCC